MIRTDFSAIYIHCDGSMIYNAKSSGGIGFVVKFPDSMDLEDIRDSEGIFEDANIERLELHALIKGMEFLLNYLKSNTPDISRISQVILITDRFDLQDENRTNPFKIKEWRSNHGKNFEGREIKNWELLNKLDKTRNKLSQKARKTVRIQYRKRKFNKEADKLSKEGRKEGLADRSIAIEGHKIGRRKFDGPEINYKLFFPKEEVTIHVFRKRFLKEQWEVNAEICSDKKKGWKLKIYTDYELQEHLQRGNIYNVVIKNVFSHHIEIDEVIKNIKNN